MAQGTDNKYAVIGGVLSLVSGAFGIIGGLAMVFVAVVFNQLIENGSEFYYGTQLSPQQVANLVAALYAGVGAVIFILGILSLVGGIFALRRKLWGLALAGSIAAVIVFFPIGVVSIIFTSLAKPEFGPRVPPGSSPVVT